MPSHNSSLPQILCLHGGGTSAAIFYAQTRNIRRALRYHFNFIFVDAPTECGPGPNVVPYFADSGPYYRWFSTEAGVSLKQRVSEVDAGNRTLERALKSNGVRTKDIAGVMGFSQGTIVSTMLLLQAQLGESAWSGLKFGILVCGACGEEFKQLIGEEIRIPTIQVHGLDDPYVDSSRMLTENFHPEKTTIMEFDGGHHMPSDSRDTEALASIVIEMSRKALKKRHH
jgi:pimeloyl-ACP methyl ester carboxylesterase